MVLINLKLCFFLLYFKLRTSIENVSVVGQGLALKFYDKFFFLMDELWSESNSDLFFLFWFQRVK